MRDLVTQTLKKVNVINNVADHNRLKGGIIRLLRDTARELTAAVSVMAIRADTKESVGGKGMESISKEMQILRIQNESMREELVRMKKQRREGNEALRRPFPQDEEIQGRRKEEGWINHHSPSSQRPILMHEESTYGDWKGELSDAMEVEAVAEVPQPQRPSGRKDTRPPSDTRIREERRTGRGGGAEGPPPSLPAWFESMKKSLDSRFDKLWEAVIRIGNGQGGVTPPGPTLPKGKKGKKMPIKGRNTDSRQILSGVDKTGSERRKVDRKGKKEEASAALYSGIVSYNQLPKKDGRRQKEIHPQLPGEDRAPRRGEQQSPQAEGSWSSAVGRKEKKKGAPRPATLVDSASRGRSPESRPAAAPLPPKRRKEPRSAVIAITCPADKYEETIREAKNKITLAELGIKDGMRCKRAVTGACLFEIIGPDNAEKAAKLKSKMLEIFNNREGVKITKPIRTAELRICDLDDSVGQEDIAWAIADIGECNPLNVRVGEIKVAPNGLGAVWTRCPLSAANRVIQAGRITIGWSRARAVMLDARPLQCYKCMEVGHVQQNCRSKVDRRGLCYRCGVEGHITQKCTASVARCLICEKAGKPTGHRSGGKACLMVKGRRNIPPARMRPVPGSKPNTSAKNAASAGNAEKCPGASDEEEGKRSKKRQKNENRDMEALAKERQPDTESSLMEAEGEDPASMNNQ